MEKEKEEKNEEREGEIKESESKAGAKESDLISFREDRDKLNLQVQNLISHSKGVSKEIQSAQELLVTEKRLRDEENARVKDFKVKRDNVNADIEKLRAELEDAPEPKSSDKRGGGETISEKKTGIWEGKGRGRAASVHELKVLKKDLQQLEWRIQTEVFTPKKEQQLCKQATALEARIKELEERQMRIKKNEKVFKKISELRSEAKAYHEMTLARAKKSEEHHSNVQKMYEKIKHLRTELKGISKEIDVAKKNADEVHEKYLGELGKITEHRKAAEREERDKTTKDEKLREEGMKQKAKDLMTAFQNGKKKLSSEELMIIRHYGGAGEGKED